MDVGASQLDLSGRSIFGNIGTASRLHRPDQIGDKDAGLVV